MNQPDLLAWTPPVILGERDGNSFSRERDGVRLNQQAQDVFNFMSDNCWHTLREIAAKTGHPEASCSARYRDFKKSKFGSWKTERRYIENGVFQYRLTGERGE